MGIETLAGLKQIGENRICEIQWSEHNRKEPFIFVDHELGIISFKMQRAPIRECGAVHGCQWTVLIEVAAKILEGLNEKFPCKENEHTKHHLTESLRWQDARTKDREKRGVEGTSKA